MQQDNIVFIFKNKLTKALKNLLNADLSLKKLLESEDEIIIKPNFVMPRRLAVTNIKLIDEVCKYCAIHGVKVHIIECPGMEFHPDQLIQFLKLKRLVKKYDNLKISIPPKKYRLVKTSFYLKKMLVAEEALETPLINIFKIKTHVITYVSLAAKNLMGIIHPYTRNFMHIKGVNKCLLDVIENINPSYNIGEAYPAMEGRGPTFGIPRYLNILVGSLDIVPLDLFLVNEVFKRPYLIDKIQYLKFYTLNNKTLYRVYGDRNALRCEKPFLLPDTSIFYKFLYNSMYLVNIFLFKLIKTSFNEILYDHFKYFGNKPIIINKDLLSKVDHNICPVQAINFSEATINYRKCIRCMECVDKYPKVFKISQFLS